MQNQNVKYNLYSGSKPGVKVKLKFASYTTTTTFSALYSPPAISFMHP